ncbi:MobF family relaxase [Pseudonocardia thermophila]|uniref:MobF family relaxase n=1 Tax=Pseudonocardia thermophila TaxID=1848 RepID=UPI00248EB844|nr:MobF family relaxase [Pseudonocardia thermophila]
MVLRVTSGYSPEYLLKEVATGRESYYTGAVTEGEPPGRWWGAGAEKLGLSGLVDAQDMRALYERFLDPRAEGFRDPERWDETPTLGHAGRKYATEDELYERAVEQEPNATPERLAELRVQAGKNARQNVAFFDLTFSVQKSVTLIHTAFEAQEMAARRAGDEETAAAWAEFRLAVEDAIWAGNNAGLAYFAEKAGYARTGHHGGEAGRWVDAHGWTVASFFQHDSREHDPQLHIHNGLLNRVEGPDGKWLTLDSKALFKFRPAAAAVAERTTEERLTQTLGLLMKMRPDGKAREVVGVVQEAMDLISTRRHQVTAKTQELVDAFEATRGRSPNGLELERMAQQATLLTRRAKSHDGETREQLLDRIDERIRTDIDGGLAAVAQMVLEAREAGVQLQDWSPAAVIETALADVQSRKAGWTSADLTAAINTALPDYIGNSENVGELLDSLTAEALQYATELDAARPGDALLPDELRLENGESAYRAPGARLYATPDQVRTERSLLAAARGGDATALPRPVADRFLAGLASSGIALGVDQEAAIRGVLTSGARVETLVGPAGTGKSFVVGTIARGWIDPELTGGERPRRVFGLATSQVATDVLTAEGLTARNVARWLATQDRLADHAVADDHEWALHAGDLVVVDESAMTDTSALAEIYAHVERAGAKLLLVGDHRQLAAVGAGGGMDLIAATGARYELIEARRFADEWERTASLRLRDGEEDVLRSYHQHGRLLDSGTRAEAETSATSAWLADTLDGKHALLLVDTNEQAAALSAQLRAELVRLGRVEEDGVQIAGKAIAGVGDLVQARWNGWAIAGVEGNERGPINRETYRVVSTRENGSLEVELLGAGARMVLPADYVREHLALGYASTVHAAQGRTVDVSHAVITQQTARAALYVALSRGREANYAHVATTATVDDPARGSDRHDLHRDPIAVLAGILDDGRDPIGARSALAIATESADTEGNVRSAADLLADAAHLAATARTARWLDDLTEAGHITPEQRGRIAAEDGAPSLARVLRRAELAGLDPQQTLADAVIERPLTGSRNTTNVLHNRITGGNTRTFDPQGSSWSAWTPRVDDADWTAYLGDLAAAADRRAAELGKTVADEAPEWAVTALGPVPNDAIGRDEWIERAGVVAAYRELRSHADDSDVLGSAPQAGQVEHYAAYRAAWRALDRPEIDRVEHQMSDGLHRMRLRAWEREKAWGPRYVGHELAGTRQAADRQRRVAALRRAEAETAIASRDELLREADEAAALAETLTQRVGELEQLDAARSTWLAHVAGTRAAAEVSEAILAERHAGDEPEERVTAGEWLAAERASREEDDARQRISEHEIREDADAFEDARHDERAEPAPLDVREVAATEPRQAQEDVVRVPSAEETADALTRANRALAEMKVREVEDVRVEEEARQEELGRWHDETAQVDDVADATDDLTVDAV